MTTDAPAPPPRAVPHQPQGKADALLAAAREHPTAFAQVTRRDYDPQWFHWLIGDALRRVSDGALKRLMVFMPPRYGKTELITIRFPAWHKGRHPDQHIMSVSYTTDYAEDYGGQARDIILSPEYRAIFPHVRLRGDTKARDRWVVEDVRTGRTSEYNAAGFNGQLTGRGAHILIIDDPIKNRESADSDAHRRQLKNLYTSAAYTRLEGDCPIILVQTRWHEDDLAGWQLAEMAAGVGDDWEVINLPVIHEGLAAPEPTSWPLDAPAGAVLWPSRFPPRFVAQQRRNMLRHAGGREWNALYMQRPRAAEGNLWRTSWWRYYDRLPPSIPASGGFPLWRTQGTGAYLDGSPITRTGDYAPYAPEMPTLRMLGHYVDSSFKVGVASSFSVIATWAADSFGNTYLLDLVRERLEFVPLLLAVHRQVQKWQLRYPSLPAPVIIEDRASGQSAIQTLRLPLHRPGGVVLPALLVIPWEASGNSPAAEIARVEAVSQVAEAGRCFLPSRPILDRDGADLVPQFVDEHAAFPNGRFTDMVVTTRMALERLTRGDIPDRDATLPITHRPGVRSVPLIGAGSGILRYPLTK